MKRNIIRGILAATVAASILASCKPTENNYRQAYEAALQKKQKGETDPDMALPAGALLQDGAPATKTIAGQTVAYKREHLRYVGQTPDEKKQEIPPYCVCIARYKMPTNARSQVEDLHSRGYKEAFVAENRDSFFLTIVAGFATAEEAATFATDYAKGKSEGVFVGLDGAPVVIERR
jgi:hypothetical protein